MGKAEGKKMCGSEEQQKLNLQLANAGVVQEIFRRRSATSCPTCSSQSYVSPEYSDDSVLLRNLQSDWM